MKTKQILISFIALLLLGCNSNNEGLITEKSETAEEENVDFWNTIKNKFPYSGVLTFDFNSEGKSLNEINSLPVIDNNLFNTLTEQVEYYKKWKEEIKIFYFSKNTINEQEVGVFLSIRDFDGEEYSFDLIRFNEKGDIATFHSIANSWQAAECFGYSRSKIDNKTNVLVSQTLQKCYDEEAKNETAIDSIITKISLSNLTFSIIESDTIIIK
jgi:hypothetical protein